LSQSRRPWLSGARDAIFTTVVYQVLLSLKW
jgi:hypothetical protein